MFRGNFSIKDKLNEKIALTEATVSELPDGWLVQFSRGATISATLRISADEAGRLKLDLQNDGLHHNRIWLRLAANPDDHIYGCGEQFSYFDLRGKPFPLPEYHELALWEDKTTLRFECADTYIALLEKLTALLGRQPELPDWVYDGVTLGIQGGTEVCQQN